LTPGTGTFTGTYMGTTYNMAPVTFALMGTDPLGLNVKTTGSGSTLAYALTPTNLAYTQQSGGGFSSPGTIFNIQPTSPSTRTFDGFGNFNTAINTDNGGYPTVMNQITFDSTTTQTFLNANEVLAALVLNGPGGLSGYLAAVDIAGALTLPGGGINLAEGAIATGFAGNGPPPGGFVPVPPTAWLLGSGLVGLLLLGRRRKQG
jgi:hypothetical protein